MAKKKPAKRRIGILTGGGDCAGLNPAIKWATKGLLDPDLSSEFSNDFEVIGFMNGWAGLQDYDPKGNQDDFFIKLDEDVVRTWDRYGGTNLRSSRTNPLKDRQSLNKTLKNFEELGLHALICIGGEDTNSVGHGLTLKGKNIIGIPKTIDKDLMGTDYSLGFSTAVEVIRQEIGRLRTTAGSHNRIFVVETMGRHAGHLALQGGIAGGACMILIPEYDFDVERVMDILNSRKKSGARYDILVVAEGAKPAKMAKELTTDKEVDEFGHVRLGGIGTFLRKEIKKREIAEVRSVVLSHLQRGGEPNHYDVRMGRAFGLAAAELVHREYFGRMVCLRDNCISTVPIYEAINRDQQGKIMLNYVNVDIEYDTERYIAKRRVMNMKMF